MKPGGERNGGPMTGPAASYAIAVAVTAAAGLLRWALDPFLGKAQPFATFYVAVLLVTSWQGWRPAILATILGYLVADWFFIEPRGSLGIVTFVPATQALVYFLVTAALIYSIHRARSSSRDLAAANDSLRQREQTLLQAKQEWERTFDGVPDLIALIDGEHRIKRVNRAMAQRLALSPEQCIGLTCYECVHGMRRPPESCPHALTLTDGRIHTCELHENRLGGDFLVTTTPVLDENGRMVGSVHVSRDIAEQKQAEATLREQAKLAQLRADATEALQQPAALRTLLQNVAALLVERLDAAFARVWTLDSSGQMLELQASAGLYTHLDGAHSRVAVGQLKIGRIAQERCPLVTNQVLGDPHVPEQDWARREGLVAFAGFPLLLEGRLLGVVALFARHPLSPAAVETFGAVAGALAQALGRKQAQEALLREKDFSETAINSLPGVFYLVDAHNHLRRWNKNFESISGYSAEDIPRLTALDFLAEEDRPAAAQAIARVFATGEAITELQLLTKTGRKLPYVFTGKRLDFDGRSGYLGVGLDISERKEAEAKVARVNADLERKVQERTATLQETVAELEHFSYTITHDMRAPLRAMMGLGGILLEECVECLHPERCEYLRRIVGAADRMDKLITDALQYTGVLRQRFELNPVDTGALLQDLLESYPQFQPPHANIHIEGKLPFVLGNQAAMTQCFSNLLRNAIKFVHLGQTPEVRIWAETINPSPPIPSDISSPVVRIWFEDKGIGIEKEYHDKIWQMFQQLNKSYEGTGIGLALVRKAVERMGGKVGVESEPGQGSRFWVELHPAWPQPQPHHPHPAPHNK